MCVSNTWTGSTTTKKVTVTEREYDAEGNLTREVETVTETTTSPNYYYTQPALPYVTF